MLPGRTAGSKEYCATCEKVGAGVFADELAALRRHGVRVVVMISRGTRTRWWMICRIPLPHSRLLRQNKGRQARAASGVPDGVALTDWSTSTTPNLTASCIWRPGNAEVNPNGVLGERFLLPCTLKGPVSRNGSPAGNWSFTELKLVWFSRFVPSPISSTFIPRSRLM